MILPYQGKIPKLGKNVYLAEGVKIIGEIEIGDFSSVWFNSVLRGDISSITIGKRTNIQDLSVIHVYHGEPVVIEDDVTVGHSCVLHGCTIRRGCLIGMGSIILNNSEIGECSMVGAGSLIPQNKVYPARSLILGSPAKVIRKLTEEEISHNIQVAENYKLRGQKYYLKS